LQVQPPNRVPAQARILAVSRGSRGASENDSGSKRGNLSTWAFALWLPAAAASAVLALTMYATVQQSIRSAADDLQIQLAEDAAADLNDGSSPESVIPTDTVDPTESLAPFVEVFDRTGGRLASSASVSGKPPVPPIGVLTASLGSDRNAVTWEPLPGIRIAAVAVAYDDGYVLAGRSMRVIEPREDTTLILAGLGLLAAWVAAAAVAFYSASTLRRLTRASRRRRRSSSTPDEKTF
jgi:hypothetical protein